MVARGIAMKTQPVEWHRDEFNTLQSNVNFGDSELTGLNMSLELVELRFKCFQLKPDGSKDFDEFNAVISISDPAYIRMESDFLQNVVGSVEVLSPDSQEAQEIIKSIDRKNAQNLVAADDNIVRLISIAGIELVAIGGGITIRKEVPPR